MGGWKPAKKDAQLDIQRKSILPMRFVEISNSIQECYNKIANLNNQLLDEDVRSNARRDINTKIDFYTDELWLAINEKDRLEREAEEFEIELLKPCRN